MSEEKSRWRGRWLPVNAGASASVVPLVPKPTLTDAEREAIERLCEATSDAIDDDKRAGGCHWQDDAAAVAVVRGLLERLK